MRDILTVDLRYALRIFRRSSAFAMTAVVSLGVGIAAATGLFSIVNCRHGRRLIAIVPPLKRVANANFRER